MVPKIPKLGDIIIALFLSIFLIIISLPSTPKASSDVNDENKEMIKFVPRQILVKFNEGVSEDVKEKILKETRARIKYEILKVGVKIIELPNEADERALLNVFKSKKEIKFAEFDQIVGIESIIPNDPWYGNQWHLPKIQAPQAWNYTTGSQNIIVAILDTGVDSTHTDLVNKLVPGWNIYDNNSDTTDVIGHGTAVAGTVGAETYNGNGVASVGWNCMIMPVRISDSQGYTTYSLAANGLIWAADRGARVANISYVVSESQTVASAAKYFMDKGGVVTVSAGNQSTYISTADNPYVLTVSATRMDDSFATFSNYGNIVDLSAPGSSIYTTIKGGAYDPVAGTSFSSPIVAGVACLVMSANPSLSGAEVQKIIKESTDDLGEPGWDSKFGTGRVNAYKALVGISMTQTDYVSPSVVIDSPSDGSVVMGEVNINVTATDNVGVAKVELYKNNVLFATDTTSPYTFYWDTKGEPNGSYTLLAKAYDVNGNVASSSPVTVTVNNPVDTEPPFVNVKTSLKNTTLTISATARDNIAVSTIDIVMDNIVQKTCYDVTNCSVSLNTRKITSGTHTIFGRAYDEAGNVGQSNTVTYYK